VPPRWARFLTTMGFSRVEGRSVRAAFNFLPSCWTSPLNRIRVNRWGMDMDSGQVVAIPHSIRAEVSVANPREVRAYLLGATRDATFNRLHRTLRFAQSDTRWLLVLKILLLRFGSRSWIYREGRRNVWVLETTWRLPRDPQLATLGEKAAFVRGYFDSEGGVPRRPGSRFYIQLVQKDHLDLSKVRHFLEELGIGCGTLHNPSRRVDPAYWRIYVLTASQQDFIRIVGSWHPMKHALLEARLASE